jgi:hypothetical protein
MEANAEDPGLLCGELKFAALGMAITDWQAPTPSTGAGTNIVKSWICGSLASQDCIIYSLAKDTVGLQQAYDDLKKKWRQQGAK